MRTIGSLTLCRSLLNAALVDRFRVVVFPVITGETGRDRIYDGYRDVALEMIGSQTLDGRLRLVEYEPTVLMAHPCGAEVARVAYDVRFFFAVFERRMTRSAFRTILSYAVFDSLPRFRCCFARAFALTA